MIPTPKVGFVRQISQDIYHMKSFKGYNMYIISLRIDSKLEKVRSTNPDGIEPVISGFS